MSNNVPETDEEVIAKITECQSGPLARLSAIGIYRCHRAMGVDLMDAYLDTLRALVGQPSQLPTK